MKQKIRYILIILIIGIFLHSCERDDICIEPTTPHLIVRIYDKDNPNELKKINQLNVKIANSLLNFSSTDSIVLPVRVDLDETKYEFIINFEKEDESIDIISLTYTGEDIFVGRSCGYKTIFNNTSFTLNSKHWIDRIEPIEQQIENENQAHVKLFF